MTGRAAKSLIAAFALMGFAAQTADASTLKGAPIPYTFGEGVVSAAGSSRFVSVEAEDKTVVMRISTDGGEVMDHSTTDAGYTVPAVALDGTASGISADGGTLVLIDPKETYAQRTTEFQLYEANKLRRGPENISIEGDFGFDALSPNGETLFLIEYTNRRDPGEYQVRSYDIATGELDPDAILDSEEEPGEMRGFPQTRVTSSDGGWEYTLYDGGEHPFIHALDVVNAKTVCIDLDMIHARDTFGATLAMSADGGSIELTDRKGALRSVVDTETYKATEPAEEPEPTVAPAETGEDSGPEAAGIAAGALALMALAAIGIRRMTR
jgi:hypothetical protein